VSETGGFSPRPRSGAQARRAHDLDNFLIELGKVSKRLDDKVRSSHREDFHDGSASYDAASMAVVRIHGLLERSQNQRFRQLLTVTEQRALGTVRNIITHGGYATMDDESFWETATAHLPDVVRRLREAAEAERES
jgi:uncharacterized protein with HEPN domain